MFSSWCWRQLNQTVCLLPFSSCDSDTHHWLQTPTHTHTRVESDRSWTNPSALTYAYKNNRDTSMAEQPHSSQNIQRSICTTKRHLLTALKQKCVPLTRHKRGLWENTVCVDSLRHKLNKVAFIPTRPAQRRLHLQSQDTPVGTTKKLVKQIPVCVCVYVATGPLFEIVTWPVWLGAVPSPLQRASYNTTLNWTRQQHAPRGRSGTNNQFMKLYVPLKRNLEKKQPS